MVDRGRPSVEVGNVSLYREASSAATALRADPERPAFPRCRTMIRRILAVSCRGVEGFGFVSRHDLRDDRGVSPELTPRRSRSYGDRPWERGRRLRSRYLRGRCRETN